MKSEIEAYQWNLIAAQYGGESEERSIATQLDGLVSEFRGRVGEHALLSINELIAIEEHIKNTDIAKAILSDDSFVHFRGHGTYYFSDQDSPLSFDEIGGVSGKIAALHAIERPIYSAVDDRSRPLYRTMLCAALNACMLHMRSSEFSVRLKGKTIHIPLADQDLTITKKL